MSHEKASNAVSVRTCVGTLCNRSTSACSSENKETTPENKSSAGQIVGVWEAYDIYDPKQGTMAEEGYSKISE